MIEKRQSKGGHGFMRKKFLAVVLAAALACNTTGVSAAVQSPVAGASVFKSFGDLFKGDSDDEEDTQSDTQKNTKRSQVYSADPEAVKDSVVLDISRGNIRITGTEVSGYDTDGNPVTKTSSRYVVTGSSREHSIEIASGANANIVLSNASIIRTEAGESPIWIADDSTGDVTLTLEGTNTLQAGTGAAAIQKNCTYNGSTSKYGQLKITCGNISPSHICGADCGTLVATAGNGGAAIGGADGMGSSKINIVGGTITASGGIGAGVGGTGTKVEIGGGVIDAGTINSKDSVLNGNAILMADSVGDMKVTKGVLVQNGKGTAYGDLDLTQGMIDHLVQSGGELDISDGAQVAVADGVDASKINTNGTGTIKQEQSGQSEEGSSEEGSSEEGSSEEGSSEEKPSEEKPADQAVASAETEAAEKKKPSLLQKAGKALAKVMGQDDGVEVEEGQEEGIATVSDSSTSGNTTTTPAPIPSTQDYYRCNLGSIKLFQGTGDKKVEITPLDPIKYGELLTIQTRVIFNGSAQDPDYKPGDKGDFDHVIIYLVNAEGKKLDISNGGVGIKLPPGEEKYQKNETYPVETSVTIQSIDLGEYHIVVEFTGTPESPGTSRPTDDHDFIEGDLKFKNTPVSVKTWAGLKILDAFEDKNLDAFLLDYRPKNNAEKTIEGGNWIWIDKGNDITTGIEDQRLYPPSTAGAKTEYKVRYDFGDEAKKYSDGDSCILTISFDVGIRDLPNAEPVVTADNNKKFIRAGESKEWWNASHKNLKLTVRGCSILKTLNKPALSPKEWDDDANWDPTEHIFTDYYNDGDLDEVYVQGSDGEIGYVNLKDFNVDQVYPFIDTPINAPKRTDKTVYFEFTSSGEEEGSGIYNYYMLTQRETAEQKYTKEDVEKSQNKTKDGKILLPGFSPNITYNLYMLVEDNAGNVVQYLEPIQNEEDIWKPCDENDPAIRYGYQFTTLDPIIDGEIKIHVYDSVTGEERNADDPVAVGDRLEVEIIEISSEANTDYTYEWRIQDIDSGMEGVNPRGPNLPTYTVQKEDFGSRLICHLSASNMSGYLRGITNGVGLPACPPEYVPTNGRVNQIEHTFTFTGFPGIMYEYRIKDGEWLEIKAEQEDVVIKVPDKTILKGELEVRAKETKEYNASAILANDEPFYSSGELGVTIQGDAYYGGTLNAVITSEAIDPGLFSYQWTRDGQNIGTNSSYEVQKEDIGKQLTVKISVAGYEGTDNSATSETIRRRPLNPVITVATKQYDGTTTAEATITLDGLINNDDVTATVTNASFADKNVGENKSVRVGTQLNGEDRNYYVVGQLSSEAKGTIEPRVLDLSMQAQDKVYDGTTDAVVTITAEALPGDNIQVSGTGQFADKNAGTNKTVTPKDVQITGTDAKNYTATGSTASTTANITPKAIEIESITVADKEYDGTADATITVNFNGAVDDVNYSYTAAFDSPNVGKDKRVDATIKLEGDSATNYTLANGAATGRGNIIKAYAPYDEANIPQNLTGIEGKKLSSVYIGPGFSWKDTETVMASVGRHTYPAYYNPDPSQYSAREIELEVLVQCAEHIWGEWVITTDPTKTDLGERQRICGVCGYTETEVIPRAPFIDNEDNKVGWGDIIQAINNASSGTEIPVVMNGTETLPASVQEALQGREVSLVLHMGDDISWTIRGEDITGTTLKDINMVVTLYTDNIPSDVIDAYLPNKATVQVHLAYSGEFGFVATLRIPLGDEFAGKASTLYYYNPTRERLEMMDSNKVTSDGMGRYDFTHASDYVVALDRPANVQGGDTPSGNGSVTPTAPTGTTTPGAQGGSATNGNNGNTGTTTGTNGSTAAATGTATSANGTVVSSNGAKTEDDTPIMLYLFLLLAGTAGITAGVAYRRKRKKGN